MEIVLIVVGIWIALDIAIIGTLHHVTNRPEAVVGPPARQGQSSPALRVAMAAHGRTASDPFPPVNERRLRVVTNR